MASLQGDVVQDLKETLSTLSVVGGVLSTLAASYIIFGYACFMSLRSYAFKLVFFMSCCDFLGYGIASLYNGTRGPFQCHSQSFLISFFQLASVLWNSVISFCLYKTIIDFTKGKRLIVKWEKFFHIYVWVILKPSSNPI